MRKKILAGIVSACILLSVGSFFRNSDSKTGLGKSSKTALELMPTLADERWEGDLVDVCTDVEPRVGDRLNRGETVEPTSVIRRVEIPTEAILQNSPTVPGKASENTYKILIIPSNFSTNNYLPVLDLLQEVLDTVYEGIPVDFIVYPKSLPAEIKIYHPLPVISTKDRKALSELTEEYADTFMLLVESTQKFGGAKRGGHSVISAGIEELLYRGIHEAAHQLGVLDQYRKPYDKQSISGPQLFFRDTRLSETVMQAYSESAPELRKTNYICDGEILFTFDTEDNIMRRKYSNQEILRRTGSNEPIFSEFQVSYMRTYIERDLLLR